MNSIYESLLPYLDEKFDKFKHIIISKSAVRSRSIIIQFLGRPLSHGGCRGRIDIIFNGTTVILCNRIYLSHYNETVNDPTAFKIDTAIYVDLNAPNSIETIVEIIEHKYNQWYKLHTNG